MKQAAILYPMAALALWTLCVLLLIPYRRVRAGRAGQVRTHDFKYGESANVPPDVSIPNRNLMNLLELPVLFYAVCLTLYITHTAGQAAVALAWAYFVLRVIHSGIHLSYNRVMHRLAAFTLSNFALTALWLLLLAALPGGA